MATLLQGKPLADGIAASVREGVERLRKRGVDPALAVHIAAADPAARLYLERIERTGARFGVRVEVAESRDGPSLLDAIERTNHDPKIHGLALLTPLPRDVDAHEAMERIAPGKDVEGVHPYNVGRLTEGRPTFVPSTAEAILLLLRHSGAPLRGARAVVVGRSPILGRPVALLLLAQHATVTLAHSGTRDLAALTREADVLVVGVGRPRMITAAMVRKGAIVIDAGINATPDGVVGDVDFASVSQVAEAITPVPGGVGSLTAMLLLRSTLHAAENRGVR